MIFDFSTILVLLCALSGLIWAVDSAVFKRKRGPGQMPSLVVEYAQSFFPVFFVVLVLRSFLLEPFRIPSGSMIPTLLVGDFIVVNKFDYGIRLPALNTKVIEIGNPKRGDIVVFRYPENPATPFIKRIIGVPGDRQASRQLLAIQEQGLCCLMSGFAGVGDGRCFHRPSLRAPSTLIRYPRNLPRLGGNDWDRRIPAVRPFAGRVPPPFLSPATPRSA